MNSVVEIDSPPRGPARPRPPLVSTVPDILAWRASLDPQAHAVQTYGVAALTFGEWHDRARVAAAALRTRGVRPGDRVGLLFGPRAWTEFAVAYCATHLAGAVAVPISSRFAALQVEYMLDHSAVAAIVHDETTDPAAVARWRPVTITDLLADPSSTVDSCAAAPTDLAQILYTSGTTGRPKGVAATHANLVDGFVADRRRLALAHSDTFLHAFAVGTNAAQTMLMTALTARPTCVYLAQFTPLRFARAIEEATIGSVFVVPAMAMELLSASALTGRNTRSVRLVGSTGAPLPPALAERLAAAFPEAAIVNYYTTTEAAPSGTSMIFSTDHRAAVGRVTGGAARILTEAGMDAGPDEVGEVWLRCAHPRRYYRDETASSDTFRDGWVRTGDLGRLDRDGYLYLVDRDSDVVKTAGFKVSTVEIEAAIHEHPAVAQVAVVGRPHPVLGSSLAAVVVPRPGADAPTLPQLRQFLATRLADHQMPATLVLADALPRNDAGKVLKRQLVADLEETHNHA